MQIYLFDMRQSENINVLRLFAILIRVMYCSEYRRQITPEHNQ